MSQPSLTPAEFAQMWRGVTTTEKASLDYNDDFGNPPLLVFRDLDSIGCAQR